jgi:hypothetical protein
VAIQKSPTKAPITLDARVRRDSLRIAIYKKIDNVFLKWLFSVENVEGYIQLPSDLFGSSQVCWRTTAILLSFIAP